MQQGATRHATLNCPPSLAVRQVIFDRSENGRTNRMLVNADVQRSESDQEIVWRFPVTALLAVKTNFFHCLLAMQVHRSHAGSRISGRWLAAWLVTQAHDASIQLRPAISEDAPRPAIFTNRIQIEVRSENDFVVAISLLKHGSGVIGDK
jgi:hypothetical protein